MSNNSPQLYICDLVTEGKCDGIGMNGPCKHNTPHSSRGNCAGRRMRCVPKGTEMFSICIPYKEKELTMSEEYL